MAEVVSTPQIHGEAQREPNYLNAEKGIWSWMTTVDHKRIGVMYLVAIWTFFLVGGLLALLIRTEHLTPQRTLMDADLYNRVFTLHGVIMVFLFIVPSVPASLGNFLLPLMIGAKDVAFPRINLLSWYIYIGGALAGAVAMIWGAIDTGWTFYTPYSTTTMGKVSMMTMVVFVMGFSSILTGLNFMATIHQLRAPGMGWYQMPLFCWGIYATSLIQVLATPVIGITMVLLLVERVFHVGIFDASLGGDPVLFQHFFWFYSHPVVYIMILPGFAIISEIIPTFSRKTIFGYKAIAYASLGIALVGFMVWGHHMFVSGQSQLAAAIFSFITFLVAIPTGIKIFAWLATLYRGSISFETPMLYALAFLLMFGIGGLTGLFLGALAVDVHLHDTYFIVAHFHYVMMGGTVLAFLGGLHFWWPKMFGKMYNETLARIAWGFTFIGFNITFLSQFILGSRGMPRRYFNYLDEFQTLHVVSTIGSYLLFFGFALMVYYFVASLMKKEYDAPSNPWGARTMDWEETTSPPIQHNFHHTPVVRHGPYDFFPVDSSSANRH